MFVQPQWILLSSTAPQESTLSAVDVSVTSGIPDALDALLKLATENMFIAIDNHNRELPQVIGPVKSSTLLVRWIRAFKERIKFLPPSYFHSAHFVSRHNLHFREKDLWIESPKWMIHCALRMIRKVLHTSIATAAIKIQATYTDRCDHGHRCMILLFYIQRVSENTLGKVVFPIACTHYFVSASLELT